ncbi:hypothetical protein CRI69_07350 [Escherichia sp. E4742]|nr:hypothetical protein CRI69_07350 [Escherichia sp. E4742]
MALKAPIRVSVSKDARFIVNLLYLPVAHAETTDGAYVYLKPKHSCAGQCKHRPPGKVSLPDESCSFSLAKCSGFGANCANHRFQTL